MLDAFIIDELRRREEHGEHDSERPRLEIPVDRSTPRPKDEEDEEDKANRGVVIIEL